MTADHPRHGFDANGNPITEAYVAAAVREAESGYDSDQLCSGTRQTSNGGSPLEQHVTISLTHELRAQAEQEAHSRGCSIEDLAHEALKQYLAS